MIKRILVALDPDADTPTATHYSADVASASQAHVLGLAVIDTSAIAQQIGPGGAVGAGHYAEVSRKKMMDDAHSTADALVQAFDEQMESAGVRHTRRVMEGTPFDSLTEESKYTDLIVIGRVPHFFYNRPEKETQLLDRIVKNALAPTLVVGEDHRVVDRVVVAYDGSAPSARTLQRFAQLYPFGKEISVDVVHVRDGSSDSRKKESELLLRSATDYLRDHGFDRVAGSSIGGDAPGTRVIHHAEQVDANMIVAGAHAVSAVKRLAFGSTTHDLVKNCTVPLFLYN